MAGETTQPDPVKECISKCDKAIAAQQELIQNLDLSLGICLKSNGACYEKVDELQAKLESPFRNPFIMIGLGLVAGLVTGVVISK